MTVPPLNTVMSELTPPEGVLCASGETAAEAGPGSPPTATAPTPAPATDNQRRNSRRLDAADSVSRKVYPFRSRRVVPNSLSAPTKSDTKEMADKFLIQSPAPSLPDRRII
ncbi:hypothetical protein Ssi02_14180 [Sinosporangium siamense]|uniref:Uncharacterized protein n=1 Tax=Sinosporangium siamense TaxID=1367973 RepID=A0A919V6N5_9ACTN|nr:hypothetical protein Ssi02_14180 [Sinosporangium siamense]